MIQTVRIEATTVLHSKRPFRVALVSKQAWFLPKGERPKIVRLATYDKWADHYSLAVEEGYRVVQVQEVKG